MHRAGLSPRRLALGTVQKMSSAPVGSSTGMKGNHYFFLHLFVLLWGRAPVPPHSRGGQRTACGTYFFRPMT